MIGREAKDEIDADEYDYLYYTSENIQCLSFVAFEYRLKLDRESVKLIEDLKIAVACSSFGPLKKSSILKSLEDSMIVLKGSVYVESMPAIVESSKTDIALAAYVIEN